MRLREPRTLRDHHLVMLLVLAAAAPSAAEPGAPPMLSMLEITVDPPFELSEYDRRLLQKVVLK